MEESCKNSLALENASEMFNQLLLWPESILSTSSPACSYSLVIREIPGANIHHWDKEVQPDQGLPCTTWGPNLGELIVSWMCVVWILSLGHSVATVSAEFLNLFLMSIFKGVREGTAEVGLLEAQRELVLDTADSGQEEEANRGRTPPPPQATRVSWVG